MNSAEYALRTVLLVAERGSISVTELALALDVAPSTAHRVLANCRNSGFVRQDARGGPYVAGPALNEIALLASRPVRLRDAVDAVLHDLHEETGETVGVMILEGRNARTVQSLTGTPPRAIGPRLGRVFPAHLVAGGKAMLAAEPRDHLLRRFPGRELPPAPDGTRRPWPDFERELRLIRHRGWAYAIGDADPLISAVAAPLVLASGDPVAAITVVMPRARLGTRAEIERFTGPLLRTAARAQSRLRGGG
ncbi:IclR family transcriptional regulator [Thermopolyspora sp. NPDC052614]|uniref:IclR family transcriptional regulator n=1 Tax=Thermopolyspora sp. NPDC052614 TaxID=3155682 RepID=UPI0034460874